MSEIDLELLITLDEPDGAPEEDTFNHSSAQNTLKYWLDQPHGKAPARPTSESQQQK
jgi:hypothetical protein